LGPSAGVIGKRSAADLHIHTYYSDGQPSPRAVLEYVRHRGFPRVLAITDHNTIAGAVQASALAREYGLSVIVGEEVTSTGGHILGLFLEAAVPAGLSPEATIAAIHGQGGLAVAVHPFYQPRRPQRAIERPTMESVGALAGRLPFDAIEVHNGTPFLRRANERALRFNRSGPRRAETGASDAHILDAIGKACTIFPGETVEDLRQALLSGTTLAHGRAYRARELLRYLHFWLSMSIGRRSPAW
jgi:predicted metal-dependent phosphoesterase TrpH